MYKFATNSKNSNSPEKSISFFQAKYQVNTPGDVYEQEADAMADKVVQTKSIHPANSFFKPVAISSIQRTCAHCEEEEKKKLQRKEENGIETTTTNEFDNYVDGLNNSGTTLPSGTKTFFESRMGYDFSNVKVHTNSVAAKSAQSINALAYTSGNNIVFNQNQYQPETDTGKKLLAHELTHVVQQGGNNIPRKIQKWGMDNAPIGDPERDPNLRNHPGGGSPAPLADSISSCNASQTGMITASIAAARTWINNVEPRLTAFQGGTASATDRTIITNALNDNFHTTSAADVSTLTTNFGSLKSALNGSLAVECVSSFWCGENELAYVRGAFAVIRRLGDVNLCPFWFSCSNALKRHSTIVHEVSHQYPGTGDQAYEHQSAYATLSSSSAMDNAASYEVFTRQVYHNGSYGPGQTC